MQLIRQGNRRVVSRERKNLAVSMAEQMSSAQVGRYLSISDRTVRRVRRLKRITGDVVQPNVLGRRKRILDGMDIEYLQATVDMQPDLMGSELRERLRDARGVFVSESTISRSLARRGYTCKGITCAAAEASDEARATYIATIGDPIYKPEHLCFVDETGVARKNGQRRIGRSIVGTRANQREPFSRGKRVSVIPVLTVKGVIHLDVFSCSVTAEIFNEFVRQLVPLMNPFPGPNSVLILDNASIHHSPELEEIVTAKGCRLIYLPPYSPDLNPIEYMFSSFKSRIARNRHSMFQAMDNPHEYSLYGQIWREIYSVTPSKAEGWFRRAGYM